ENVTVVAGDADLQSGFEPDAMESSQAAGKTEPRRRNRIRIKEVRAVKVVWTTVATEVSHPHSEHLRHAELRIQSRHSKSVRVECRGGRRRCRVAAQVTQFPDPNYRRQFGF